MITPNPRFWLAAACFAAGVAMVAAADPAITDADFARSAKLPEQWAGKVSRDRIQPNWLDGGAAFWYRVDLPEGKKEFVRIDCRSGERQVLDGPPADARLAEARQVRPHPSRNGGESVTITFDNRRDEALQVYWIDAEGTWKNYGGMHPKSTRDIGTYAGHVWLILDAAGHEVACFQATRQDSRAVIPTDEEKAGRRPDEPKSDDRKPADPPPAKPRWKASLKDGNIEVTDTATGDSFALTSDGKPEDGYREPLLISPDGRRLACRRVKDAKEREISIVQSSPKDQLQPKVKTLRYAKPGDAIDEPRLALFDLEARKGIAVSAELTPTPWSLGDLRWAPDSSQFTALYNRRGHQVVSLVAVDAGTGSVREVIREECRTFIDYTNKIWSKWIDATGEILWMSEQRDGWNQLYLFDVKTGALKNRVTNGAWTVRKVVKVDEKARQVWFSAGGVWPDQDPYHEHLCRVNFDGGGFVRLTEGDGTHDWTFSPDEKTIVDRWSRVDRPVVTELRSAEDGHRIAEVEKADISALTAAGWQAPERFVAKGRDGTTDIFGIVVRPTNFDPAKKYAVIEKIYAGPQGQFVPKGFGLGTRDRQIAELGFIWVQIDGMGTNWRSKAFHDVCWKNLQDAGFPDRIAWMKAAAEKHPEMDLSRVGIYGGSAGGQNAMRALIDHGDFYKAAVADCGCHDNRMDKIWWNEQWMGWPVGPEYEAASNSAQAGRLQGQLMLTWGELDSNVDPASSMQVVNALIKANKDFEMLVVPGANHGVGEEPYPAMRRMRFFAKHLGGPAAR